MNRQYFFALNELIKGNIKRKFSGNYLWIIWYVVSPLAVTGLMSALFSKMQGLAVEHYPVYYLTGHIVLFMFASIVTQCIGAIGDNRRLFADTRLPRNIFVVAKVLSGVILAAFSLVSYPVLMVAYDIKPTIKMLVCLPVIVLVILFSAGVGCIFSVLSVFLRNIKYVVQIIMAVAFLASAVFYPAESLPANISEVVEYNPIYLAAKAIRGAVLQGSLPEMSVWVKLGLMAVVAVIAGIIVFAAGQKSILQCED